MYQVISTTSREVGTQTDQMDTQAQILKLFDKP